MPMRRSPPSAASAPLSTITSVVGPSGSYDSDTPSERSGGGNVNIRSKRRREIDDDIKDLRIEMKESFTSLSGVVEQHFNEIKVQNNDLKTSIQFLSDKYDSLTKTLQDLQDERKKDKKYIQQLENKIEFLEKKTKSAGLEIRNVPTMSQDDRRSETKEEISSILMNLAESVDVDLKEYDIKDIYRVYSKKETVKPIIVELNSIIKKDKIIQAIKSFNKTKGTKLNTGLLKIPGPIKPVYVAETLTHKTQKLFYMSREFARENDYSYCWTSKGQVYLRKTEGLPLIRIEEEDDISKLKGKN